MQRSRKFSRIVDLLQHQHRLVAVPQRTFETIQEILGIGRSAVSKRTGERVLLFVLRERFRLAQEGRQFGRRP